MPVIPATQKAEGGESLEPGGGGYSELRSYHCPPAEWQSETPSQENKNKIKQKKSVLNILGYFTNLILPFRSLI